MYFFLFISSLFAVDYNKVHLKKIEPNLYVHISYIHFKGRYYPSNGLVYFKGDRALIIDTPCTDQQTAHLISLIQNRFKKKISFFIGTHHHRDNVGGAAYLYKKGIKLFTTRFTQSLAKKKGITLYHSVNIKKPLIFQGEKIWLYYPGPAHTFDNIVVWIPKKKILFAGCPVKSMDSRSMGNTKDGNINHWSKAVKKLINSYSDARLVIPGHGRWGGRELLYHTIDLLKAYFNRKR